MLTTAVVLRTATTKVWQGKLPYQLKHCLPCHHKELQVARSRVFNKTSQAINPCMFGLSHSSEWNSGTRNSSDCQNAPGHQRQVTPEYSNHLKPINQVGCTGGTGLPFMALPKPQKESSQIHRAIELQTACAKSSHQLACAM